MSQVARTVAKMLAVVTWAFFWGAFAWKSFGMHRSSLTFGDVWLLALCVLFTLLMLVMAYEVWTKDG